MKKKTDKQIIKGLKKDNKILLDKMCDFRDKYYDASNYKDLFIVPVCLAIIFFIISCGFAIANMDNLDIDDQLGPYMCGQHGYEFVDYNFEPSDNSQGDLTSLNIYCKPIKELKETQIDDGYLTLIE